MFVEKVKRSLGSFEKLSSKHPDKTNEKMNRTKTIWKIFFFIVVY